jgi:twitching motility protein PilT
MAMEILVPNAAIRNLIREDKVHQIYSMMQTGQDKYGMQTFNQSLATLYHRRLITLELALQRSSNPDELKDLIERGAGLNTAQTGMQGSRPMPPQMGMPQQMGMPNGMPQQPVPPSQHPSPYAEPRKPGVRPPVRS